MQVLAVKNRDSQKKFKNKKRLFIETTQCSVTSAIQVKAHILTDSMHTITDIALAIK